MGPESLDDLLLAAAESPPETRIMYRDPIAEHGNAAIARLATPEWIGDPHYAAFAIRTISRAAAFAGTLAIQELRRALDFVADETLRRDIEFELARAGIKAPTRSRRQAPTSRATSTGLMSVDDLEVGDCYRRRDLHLNGLGGNWQRGISYPRDGTYCLLFSDASHASEYGYRDAPRGHRGISTTANGMGRVT